MGNGVRKKGEQENLYMGKHENMKETLKLLYKEKKNYMEEKKASN
jgi:hypothetical protein